MNRLQKTLLVGGLVTGGILLTPGCSSNPASSGEPRKLAYNTVQCEATPWEDSDFKSHYEALGAEIIGVDSVTYQKVVTAACGTPTGQRVIATVKGDDSSLRADGFFDYVPGKRR